jgi:Bacterial tandem repeat domain 1
MRRSDRDRRNRRLQDCRQSASRSSLLLIVGKISVIPHAALRGMGNDTDFPLEYRTESAEQKRRGLMPISIRSYGDGDDVRHAAIWVRYLVP